MKINHLNSCTNRPGKSPTNVKPVATSTFFDEFISMLDRHDIALYNLVIAGDFNFHLKDDDDADASNFLNVLFNASMNGLMRMGKL